MTQRDKVKELVGKGLHSYHTKALQQIDRIEKKNKEQNHKISILTNELDNDYLTKTEEGSVISLEHSKEGMVCIDELQGNTLVNYCTDGSKEMTLNGDIDTEGIFVTTTEGVDNGKIDVMCEGNTLVNYISNYNYKKFTYIANSQWQVKAQQQLPFVKLDTEYTFFVCVDMQEQIVVNNEKTFALELVGGNSWKSKDNDYIYLKDLKMGKNYFKIKATMQDTQPEGNWYTFRPQMHFNVTSGKCIVTYMCLEGNHLDKELEYFEGMKSVGQDDENGHKIEIFSGNKNFRICDFESGNIDSSGNLFNQISYLRSVNYEHCVPNTEIIASYHGLFRFSQFFFYDKNKNFINRQTAVRTIVPNNARYFKLVIAKKDGTEVTSGDINSYANKTTMVKLYTQSDIYIEPKLNKKEIFLKEPLRGLPNGVKDKFVKIGGKWFIERNCGEIIPTYITRGFLSDNQTYIWMNRVNDIQASGKTVIGTSSLYQYERNSDWINLRVSYDTFIKKGYSLTAEDCNRFLEENPTTVIYQRLIPIYEPLEIEPTLNTYTDVTHISNNSIIPCNMKIKNSGYNTIIKPSTLYTVALDTNKSGTIGINLGGAKGTTTNNVLKLTTPATLSDDSLRVSGKWLKGSKFRLLEGDKTNWIPSHFEGMKSSFEDKVQEDGSYKMEIFSVNKHNLLDISSPIQGGWSNGVLNTEILAGDYTFNHFIEILPNVTYRLETKGSTSPNWKGMYYFDANKKQIGTKHYNTYQSTFTFVPPSNAKYMIMWCEKIVVNLKPMLTVYKNKTDYVDYTELLYNKIQFSSVEPLRSVDNIKDRFVLKDGKVMIERNVGYNYIDGTCDTYKFANANHQNTDKWYGFDINFGKNHHKISTSNLRSDKFKFGVYEYGFSVYQDYCFVIRIPRYDTIVKLNDVDSYKEWFKANPTKFIYELAEPTYEEIPIELQKIILEGYENGTLFFNTNIPPTSTITYAGETPIVSAIKTNELDIVSNTQDINDNIIPYLMDMDYRVVCLELAGTTQGVSMTRLFGGTFEMLQRDIQSKRYSIEEYRHRLDVYLDTGKITEDEFNKLGDMLNE